MRPGVFLTFDVECSMGGAWGDPALGCVPPERAVWGDSGDRRLGLPLICDILADSGNLKATFFVDPYLDEQGFPDAGEPICRFLLDRGQDVQLHVHPVHKLFGCAGADRPQQPIDDIADFAADEAEAMLVEAAGRLAGWCGASPVAFRAGNMGASKATLALLPAAGIRIDSSYTFPYAGRQCRFSPDNPYNGSRWYGDVLELGLSGFRQPRLPKLHPAKPLDLMGISFGECREAIRRITVAGADAVVILHSFSLMKVRNRRYDGGRLNRVVARRFRKLCDWLARSAGDLPTYTFGHLAEAVAAGQYQAREAAPCRLNRPVRAVVRKAVQAVNNVYWT
jgi:peptidoglycan/xylan/chitin deacetylase (PgdA/CDA1 family)